MFDMRNLVAILAIILQLLLGWWYYNDFNSCCAKSTADAALIAPVTKDIGPLLYKYNSGEAITNEKWAAKKAELLAGLKDGSILEITGIYGKNETNTSTFADLGLARADAARKLFSELPDDRVKLLSRMIDSDPDKVNPFESCDFAYRVNNDNIKEVQDKTLIYFPFNSTDKLDDNEVEAYLNDVATRVKTSGEKISLTGHTDNIGDDSSNVQLGQRRANIIKNYLVAQGVPEASITATSQGESAPIASNDTEEGRQQNRRTELQIIK